MEQHICKHAGIIPSLPDILSDMKIIEYIFISFHSIFSNCLSAQESNIYIDEVDQLIRKFLTYADKLDEIMRQSKSTKIRRNQESI